MDDLFLMARFNRQVLVYVRDGDNRLVEGALIRWKENGKDRGIIENSDGHGALTIFDPTSTIEVTVKYGPHQETRKLAVDQNSCTIVFPDLHVIPNWTQAMERHFPAIIGIFFILITIALAFVFSNPTALQTHIILAILSLGGGAFGTEISGMIKVDLSLGAKFVIGATGAAAIFVILYFAVPAS